ncbi:hypothetical protein [Halorientalis marina]|uniref:hypothetical protein n=1 Tax=Halorientalis marina TaxID=2931976 RepID=UPI001FF4B4AA|nr:hypothetical protein [Halorientalis marina]
MIVVATEDFEVYHGVVNELRDRGVEFTTVEPDEKLPEGAAVLVTGPDADPDAPIPVIRADPDDPRRAVDEALATLRGDGGRTVVGVDPGERPGIAVLVDDVVVAAFQVPESEAASVVGREVADATDPLVRIGDGARLVGARVIDDIEGPVELVDETGTTPYLGSGARGMGDVLAAVNIARTEGERVESREIEPTDGEIKRIKDRSRNASETNRAIDDALARRVATGDLSIEEALARHRERESDADTAGPSDAEE